MARLKKYRALLNLYLLRAFPATAVAPRVFAAFAAALLLLAYALAGAGAMRGSGSTP